MNLEDIKQYLAEFGEYENERPLIKYIVEMYITQEKEQKLEEFGQKSKLFFTIIKKAFKAYVVNQPLNTEQNQFIDAKREDSTV